MAQLLNKDPAVYRREADAFLSDLKGFHGGRGTAFQRTPKVGGRDVDLYLLYVLVTTRGGWEKVNDYNEWDTLAPLFGMPMACVNVGLALKQIYLRYLDHYEKVHFHGEELYGRHDDEMIMHDTTSRSSRRHNVRALNAVAMTYNSGQHIVSDSLRQSLGMSAPRQPSEYDRLLLSLLGPLPNEQDFAINLCTLLSNEGRHELRLSKHPRLMGALLAHAGVFTDGYTQKYMLENYSHTKRQNLVAFWRDSLSEKKLLRLLSVHYAPERRPQTGPGGGRDPALLFSPARAELHHLSDSDSEEEPDAELDAEVAALSSTNAAADDDEELFCLGTQLGVLERTGHRVLQVSQVLRSLSFEPENAAVMAASAACLRFLLLCAHCRWGSLSSSARDTLGNIAGDVVLRDAASDRLGRLLVHYVARGVQHADRSVVLGSLEVLNKLAQNERNEEPLASALDARILQTVCTYLSLHDILLLISSLECLLGLTSLGEDTCRAVARAPGAVSMLVSLVTVEAQSYGPRACILMKVMQTPVSAAVPAAVQAQQPGQPVQPQQVVQQQQQQQQHAVVAQQNAVVAQHQPQQHQPQQHPQQHPQQQHQQPPGTVRIQPHPQALPVTLQQQQQLPIQPIQPPIQLAPQPTTVRQVPMPFIQPSQPTVLPKGPSSHLGSAPTENSMWTVKWLQTVCEVSAGQSIEQGVLYKQYTASAAAQHWKGIITQGEFANCVRSVFGSAVNAIAKRLPSGVTEYHFEGIRSKLQIVTTVVQPPAAAVAPVARLPQPPQPVSVAVPAPTPAPAPLTSSILKAQLSAPPRPEVPRPKELPPVSSQAVPASPRLSQALLGGPAPGREPTPPSASSSLIKSLLASKVAPPPPLQPAGYPAAGGAVSPASPAGGLSASCFTTPQAQVARNMQNKRLAVNGISENEIPGEQPSADLAAAGDGAVHNGVKPSPPNSNATTNAGSGEGLLADLLAERKYTPVNGIDKELRIGERGLELVNNNNGTSVGNVGNVVNAGGGCGEGGEQQMGAVNGGAPPVKRNGTDLLASALDMAGLMDDLGAMDDDDDLPAISTPPPPQQPAAAPTPPLPAPVAAPQTPPQPAGQQGFKRPAEGVAGGEAKRMPIPIPVPVAAQSPAQPMALQSAMTAGGQQVVMVPQSMANMVLKLPANVNQGQQLLLPQGQLMMTSSGQLVLGQHQAQVMVQGAGAGNVVVGQPAVGQPQTVLVAQTPQQQGTATRTLIFLPPNQKVYVSQPGMTHQGQLMVQVTRAGGQTQVVNSTVVTGSRAAQQHLRGQPQPIVSVQQTAAVVAPGRAVPSPQPPRPPLPPPPPPQPQTQPALPTGVRSASPAAAPQPPAPAVTRAPSVAPTPESVVGRPLPPGLLCEWRGCLRGFPTAFAVYQHAIETHCPPHLTDIPCLWERCDGMIRKRYSMMTHLQDRHCPEQMLRLMRKRREQLQATGKTDIPTPSAPPPHPGYANNAALQAIRRHALSEAKSPPDEKEGPVTKSIRLTAALILRNIAVFSQHGRRVLRAHESHLLNIAASSAESSRTIGQLLADLHESDPS